MLMLYPFSQSQRLGPVFCTCSLPACKGSHSLLSRAFTRSQLWGMYVGLGVRHAEHWECPWAIWLGPQRKHLQQLMGRLFDGIQEVIHRICLSLMSSGPGFWAPRLSLPLHHADHLSTLNKVRYNWFHLTASTTDGKARCSLIHYHFLLWEKSWTETSLLALSCAALQEVWHE